MAYEYKLYKMFQHGCNFYDCSTMCRNVTDLREHFHFKVPQIVNLAFACEVFLKTIILTTQNEVRGHELKKLWSELDHELRVQLMVAIQDFTKLDESTILQMIENISNAFTEWRYLYEVSGLSIQIGFLEDFTYVLRDTTCKILYNKSYDEYTHVTK